MGSAGGRTRVSQRVRRDLERRTRAIECHTDVLERVPDDTESEFDDGFGILADEQADRLREQRETDEQQRRERMRRLGDS